MSSAHAEGATGGDTVFVIPVGPNCQMEFVADTIESIEHYAPASRVVIVDDSLRGIGAELGLRFQLTVVEAKVHGLFGNLYLNLSDGMREALTRPFRILIRLDTDALIAGSDFESKAVCCFTADERLGSLGSFRVGYDTVGIRNRNWAKRRILVYVFLRAWRHPRAGMTVVKHLVRARKHGYKFGESIMGGAAVYRREAVEALDDQGLLGCSDLAAIGVHEDHLFGLCLFSAGYRLGEFGNRNDDLPMGVDWRSLPAEPAELIRLGKSIIHSSKRFGSLDEAAIRAQFRAARQLN
jgi:hypothetical protein